MPLLTSDVSTEGQMNVRPGEGNDTVQYNINAPVSVDGGSGFDGVARFVDGARELVYRFEFDPGTEAAVEFEIGAVLKNDKTTKGANTNARPES
mgnify:CR=1 FL=1